ncbi:hypothetical protein PAHAL_7G087000 [Panicum hallii]|uniref:Uncharacterized protein n=1 Tax=Panicum hallii TaxID=206008 RepID=A0A2T8IBH9_9POAL|nr:hypothetical protein PAHAL_7G087000 [Panicum hallii]
MLMCGAIWTERERERGENGALRLGKRRRQVGPSWQREEGREVRALRLAALRELGLGGPCGERREGRGKRWAGVERRKGWWACVGRGRAGCWALPSSSSFPFSLLHSTIQTSLFEFK